MSTPTPAVPVAAAATAAADLALDRAAVNATTAEELRERGTLKWTGFPGTIGAWVAEMDLPLASPVADALTGAIAAPLLGYLPSALTQAARQACADWYGRATGWAVDVDDVFLVPDVLVGLAVTLDTLAPGSTAVVTTPAYMPFLTRPDVLGHELRTVAARQRTDGSWEHDLEALEATLSSIDGPAVLILCNPWNPVGRVLTREELLAIADVVERTGATVFSDEIHAPVVFDGVAHVPYASVSEVAARHSITAVSASKAWNTPGLKCAQLIATVPAHRDLLNGSALTGHEPSTLGVIAATAAYDDGQPWLDGAVAWLEANRTAFAEELAAAIPGALHSPPEGTYLAWADLRGVRTASGAELPADLGQFFRSEAGVALQDGAGCGYPGFIRFNLALPEPLLREAVRALGAAVTALP